MLSSKDRLQLAVSTVASLVTAAVLLYTGGGRLFRLVLDGSTGVLLPQPPGILIPAYEVLLGGGMIAANQFFLVRLPDSDAVKLLSSVYELSRLFP